MSLSTRWNVEELGWFSSEQWAGAPTFSEDGQYVVTSYPAVFDADTGELLWEGQEADLQQVTEGVGVSFTAPQGTFEVRPEDGLEVGRLDLSDAEAAEVISLLGEGRLQADESAIAPLSSDTDGRGLGLAYVSAEIGVSKPGERTPAQTGDHLCGVYDSTKHQLVWAARVTSQVSPPMLALLSEEA
ncbi:hypothetical protein EG829_32340, partial [bacterium]|nr:hypothetical protein [bacterium]